MKKLALALVLVLTASMSVAAAADAHKGHGKLAVHAHGQNGVQGKVSAVGSDSITLSHKNGFSLTIPVTSSTEVYVNGAEATLADVHVGFHAVVARNDDGTAKKIWAKDPEFRHTLHGQITALASDSVTLKLRNGDSKDIALTADTKIRVNGHRTTLANVRVGDRAFVKLNADGTAKALFANFRSLVRGTVAAVGSDSITLTLRNGDSLEIGVTADTKISVDDVLATLADVQVGMKGHVKLALDRTARRIVVHAVS